jgi:hypothetical protein
MFANPEYRGQPCGHVYGGVLDMSRVVPCYAARCNVIAFATSLVVESEHPDRIKRSKFVWNI